MAVVHANDAAILHAANIIRTGGLVAFPTETVYGLGANALDESAVGKIFTAKGRPPTNPLIVHIANLSDLSQVTGPTSGKTADRLQKLSVLWPGPFTAVLPANEKLPKNVTAGLPSVGVRIPNHPVALQLLKESRVPIAAPSANVSKYVSPTTAAHVEESLGANVDMILDGGSCSVGLESTILSLLDTIPVLLRKGAILKEDLEKLLCESIDLAPAAVDSAPALSPGLMALHYSPNTPLSIRNEATANYPSKTGLLAFRTPTHLEFDYQPVRTLSKSGDLYEVAQNLYSALRDFDKLNLELIVIDRCDEQGIGSAIMDRVRRAAARK